MILELILPLYLGFALSIYLYPFTRDNKNEAAISTAFISVLGILGLWLTAKAELSLLMIALCLFLPLIFCIFLSALSQQNFLRIGVGQTLIISIASFMNYNSDALPEYLTYMAISLVSAWVLAYFTNNKVLKWICSMLYSIFILIIFYYAIMDFLNTGLDWAERKPIIDAINLFSLSCSFIYVAINFTYLLDYIPYRMGFKWKAYKKEINKNIRLGIQTCNFEPSITELGATILLLIAYYVLGLYFSLPNNILAIGALSGLNIVNLKLH